MSSGARTIRVGRAIQEVLGTMLERGVVKDPRVSGVGLLSVTEVRVSPDLQHARVFVSIFAEEPAKSAALAGLRHAAGFLGREVGKGLHLRRFPELDFRIDDSMERAAHIDQVLRDISDGENESS